MDYAVSLQWLGPVLLVPHTTCEGMLGKGSTGRDERLDGGSKRGQGQVLNRSPLADAVNGALVFTGLRVLPSVVVRGVTVVREVLRLG